ncbi:cysteine protease [Brachybacterium sp. P6-10-X1]|uniref:transglutaminase domain-containing protein n=1 Tax=Brachybacterium sp. P6-10-X1 TaxID=1903186 RepID=UPI00097187FE|nr:transglutaminase domain-containing protein [Brachybacterium sp. P6-10-X1]APX32514.1 cysteine protease [Brachybacterium sp. P6-10-X1]
MTATTARAHRPSFFSNVTHGRRAADIAVLATLFLLALIGFQTVYGGIQYLLTGIMAMVFGTLIALIAARFRWGPLRITPLVLAVYFLFGSMFAAPTRAIWGIVPSLGSLKELLFAPVTSWKAALTVAPPVGSAQGVLGVVWIGVLILTLLGMTVVLRTRFYVLAWLFPIALVLLAIVFGTTDVFWPVLRGVLFAVISVGWLTWRFEGARLDSAQSTIISDTVRPGSWKNPVLRRRVIGGAVIMALAGGLAVGAQALLDPPEGTVRYAQRNHITPPFDPHEYVSPLSEFRGYLKNQREEELFTVTDVEGGTKLRLATMDQYNLQVYDVAGNRDEDSASGAFLPTATGVTLHEAGPDQRTSTITIGAYSGVWMPTIGQRTDRIDIDGMPIDRAGATAENLYLNEKSQTAVNASGVRQGDTYDLRYQPYEPMSTEEIKTARFADIELPPNSRLDKMAAVAEEWAGTSESDYERFANLQRGIKAEAYYSHGLGDDAASLPGHGASRLLAMLEPIGFDEDRDDAQPLGKIGDEEQFAALTAVLARSIGIPARVVMGFEVPEGQDGTVSLTGDDVTAWVEVAFEGQGWERFEPAPEEDEEPTQPEPKDVEKPLPQVAQPPPPPAEPPSPPPGAMSEDSEDDEDETDETTSWVVYAAYGMIPIVLVILGVVAVIVAKSVRRGRRRTRGGLPDRIDGGWQEILDLMTDLGRKPDPIMTRAETAARLHADLPELGALTLAGRADRAVFGPDDLSEPAVQEYWSHVMTARDDMTAAVPWHKKLRAAISLRSFRSRSQNRRAEQKRERAAARAREKAQRRAEAMRRRRSSLRSMQKSRAKKSSRKGSS